MNKSLFTAVALATVFAGTGLLSPSNVVAQDNILAEMYGRGVHAFYAGRYSEAHQHLSTAIDGGISDPRAYYFRGIVSNNQGRQNEAEADWKEGARLEAIGNTNLHVGRSLSRFQGSARLKLEEIRQAARIDALSGVTTRTDIRMQEIQAAQPPLAGAVAPPRVPATSRPITLPALAGKGGASPFASDASLAGGRPQIDNDDALADAMNDPFKDDGAPAAALGADPAAAAPAGDPFGGAAAPAGDPFGGGADPAADPFGGAPDATDAAPMSDPFGADPFGN